ncbi:hypothetical protein FQR65_LT16006 [Abscondita terminalis]|nr:hypothetical protein FQR65_LT16006 [Abscondita terminalis]
MFCATLLFCYRIAYTFVPKTFERGRLNAVVWTQRRLDAKAFGRKGVWTQRRLDAKAFGRKGVWTQRRLDAKAFGRKGVWTQGLLHAKTFEREDG